MDYKELLDELRGLDETILIELLEVDSTDIVDAFLDEIADNEDRLIKYFNDQN